MIKSLQNLNTEQKEAVITTEGPLLVIAGAGTGKTTVIGHRIAYLIEKKLAKPAEILALTFTDKAAQEMEDRVDVLVPYGFIDTWISTFHAFGDRLLRENALELGLSPDFRVLTRAEQVLFFQQNLFHFDLSHYRPLGNPTKFIRAILDHLARVKDEDVTPEEYLKFAKSLKTDDQKEKEKQLELARVFGQYEELKSQAGLVDFGDQIVLTLKLFRQNAKILKEYQEKFKYILVDEYQDTNYAQNQIVKFLAARHQNICVTGDDDQSIYKFRGAAISNILEFVKNFPRAKQVVLTQNYRSTQAILDTAYKLVRHNNPDRLEIKNKIAKKLKSSKRAYGSLPQRLFGATLSEETDLVAQKIKEIKKTSGYLWRDFAILVRANNHAQAFIGALNMAEIPFKFTGTVGFYEQEEIRLLIAFLNSLSHFSDSLSLYHLAVSEIYQLDTVDCVRVMDYCRRKNLTLHDAFEKIRTLPLELSEKSLVTSERIISDINKFVDLSKKESAGRVLYQFLETGGYLKKLEKEGTAETEQKIQNIARFFEKITDFARLSHDQSVHNFVEYLEVVRQAGEDPQTAEIDPDLDAVNLLTVHGAKGLEFKVVFLVNLVADRFPSREKSEQVPVPDPLIKETLPTGDFHLQEERRLFYVGMTRACDLLYFSWARDYGGKRLRKASPFVYEALDLPKIDEQAVKSSPLEKIKRVVLEEVGQLPLLESRVIRLNQQQIDDYLTCPLKYKYVNILRIPILKHHAVIYGFAMHKAVEEFYRQKQLGKILPLSDTLSIFENSWEQEGFLTAEHEQKRLEQGRLALNDFWQRESKTKDRPTFIEKQFRFAFGEVVISGRWDRVDVGPNFVKITDFKSSEDVDVEKAMRRAKESIQLGVYALAYQKIYQRLPNKVGLYFLENGTVGEYKPDEKTLAKTEEQIKTAEEGIKEGNFEATPSYFVCNYCAYNSICPFAATRI